MNNNSLWPAINAIIAENFTAEGMAQLEDYAAQFITGNIVYKRFSPTEQYGCTQGGVAHVIASILAGAGIAADTVNTSGLDGFKREQQCAQTQMLTIEKWAKKAGCWFDDVDDVLQKQLGDFIAEGGEAQVYYHGATLIKTIGLDYYIQPLLALDRITLHNAWFPETRLMVLGFGKTTAGDFVVIVEQQFIQGSAMTDAEIASFAESLGFELKNPKNWTFSTPDIYLSDLHDENVIRSAEGNVFVIDCDIRLNTPELNQGGIRELNNELIQNTVRHQRSVCCPRR